MKILRRQKIYTETIYNFKEVKTQTEDKIEATISNKTFLNNFSTYIDKYFTNNESLPSFSIDFNDFIQNDCNMLLSKATLQFEQYYVPVYCKKSNKLIPGILLDIPKITALEKLCSDSFIDYVPILSFLPKEELSSRDISHYFLSRIPLVQKRPKIKMLNLDEIVPIVQEVRTNTEGVQTIEEPDVHSQLLQRQVLILDPLNLDTDSRQEKQRLKQSEHNKLARITIMYTLAFFALALVTFFIIYLA